MEALATAAQHGVLRDRLVGPDPGRRAVRGEVVSNLNLFPVIVDRLQQAVLNTLYLGRLMISPHGFAANPDFQSAGDRCSTPRTCTTTATRRAGSWAGCTLAVSPDVRRAVLGVTGMDYGNLLLARSTDFATFSKFLGHVLPGPVDVPGDPRSARPAVGSGRSRRLRAVHDPHPLPDTPSHQVLMQIAYGDFQVSMYAGAAEARTIGARAYEPALDPDRARDRNLFYGIPAIGNYPVPGVGDRDLGQRAGPGAGAAGRERPADRGCDEHRPALGSA